MRTRKHEALVCLLAAATSSWTFAAAANDVGGDEVRGADLATDTSRAPVGSTISYQGELTEDGLLFDGSTDITFRLFDAASGGTLVAPAIVASDVEVTSGRFVVELDFGPGSFDGDGRWLELQIGGVTLSPRQPLHPAPYALHALSAPGSGGDLWVYGSGTISTSANVGIGTSSPAARLHIRGSADHFRAERVVSAPLFGYTRVDVDGSSIQHTTSLPFTSFEINSESSTDVVIASGGGKVGIGGGSPQVRLHVKGGTDTAAGGGGFAVLGETNGLNVSIDNNEIMARSNGGVSPLYLNNEGGHVYIGSAASTATHLIVPVVQITGADVAERFPTSERVAPGDVVEIDAERPGELRLSRGAYNRRVAGVVSGANALPAGAILGNLPGAEDAPPVAMAGRVWVRCSEDVQPGDLLTTSDTPGHAMAARDHTRAQGAIIGKAMTARDETTGMALMLISLQ